MKPGAATLLGIAIAICLGAPASSATIKSLPGKDRRVVIQITGQIAAGDADVFINAVKAGKCRGQGRRERSAKFDRRQPVRRCKAGGGDQSREDFNDGCPGSGLCLRLLSGLCCRRSEICRLWRNDRCAQSC
jgi:hypothetical protein